jgi:hypothetical protein
VFVALLVLGLAAVACGSSSSSNNNSSGGGSTASSSTGSTTTPPVTTGSSSGTAWCGDAKKWQSGISKQIESAFVGAGTDPTKLKAAFGKLTQIYQAIENSAPSDIKPSVVVLVNAYLKVVGILQKYNFNYEQAAPALASSTDAFNSAQVKAAEKNIESWAKANGCTT